MSRLLGVSEDSTQPIMAEFKKMRSTAPAIVWAFRGAELVAICSACRLEHDLTTKLTTVPPGK